MLTFVANVFYHPLKIFVFILGHLYFKQLKIIGRENLPIKGPAILAINHQNALLDALLISAYVKRSTYFITRGDVFKKPIISKILHGLKMLPVYRLRDGYFGIRRNDRTFETVKKLLLQDRLVGIFPEGSHSLLYKIRPLKKGVARLAFMTEETSDFSSGLQVIPIGIQYESHFGPTGRTLITIGKPIQVADFKNIYLSNQNQAYDQLLHILSTNLKSLVIDIQGDYDKIYNQFIEKRIFKNHLSDQLQADQSLVRSIETNIPFTLKSEKVPDYKKVIYNTWNPFWLFMGFIPKYLVDMLVRKFTQDPHYYGTMRFIYSIFLYPIFFLLVLLVIMLSFN